MELILKTDVPNLGLADEIVVVRPGYGRNFLIPKGMAILATPSAKKNHAETMRQRAHKLEKIKNDAIALAEQLNGKKLSIGAKTSTSGKIFGSVNTIQLAEAIQSQLGIEIDRRKIAIKGDHIKETGTYSAKIKLHKDVTAELEFDVVSE